MHVAIARPTQRLNLYAIVLMVIVSLGGIMAVHAPAAAVGASLVLSGALVSLILIQKTNVLNFALICMGILISFFAFLPRPTDDRVGPAYGGSLDLRAIAQLAIFAAVLAIGCWLWMVAGVGVSDLTRFPLNILGLYVVTMTISLLYAPSLSWSGYGVLKFLTIFVLLAVLSSVIQTEAHLRRMIDVILGSIILVLGIYWIDILSGTAVRRLGRYETSWFHPNHATLLAITVMIVLTVRFLASPQPRSQGRMIALAGFSAVSAMMASSKSSLGAAAIAILLVTIVIIVKKPTGSMIARMAILVMAGLGIVNYFLVTQTGIVAHLSQIEESDSTSLTGRVPVWQTAIESTLATPFTTIFGHGYLSTFAIGLQGYFWVASQAHNSFIQTFFDLGVIGLILVVILYVTTWSRAWRSISKYSLEDPRWVRSLEILAVLTAYTIVSFTEDLMGGTMENTSMIFLLIMFCVSKCLTIAPNDVMDGAGDDHANHSTPQPDTYSDRDVSTNSISPTCQGGGYANPASS